MTNDQTLTPGDPLGDSIDFSGHGEPPMSEKFKFVTDVMKARMMEQYTKEWNAKIKDPIIRSTKIITAKLVLDDAFKVFAQCMEQTDSDEQELTPG